MRRGWELRRLGISLLLAGGLFSQTVNLIKPDDTTGAFSPVTHPRILLDGAAGSLSTALADPDGAGSLKNGRLCSDGTQNCSLANETLWARSARAYMNNSTQACNGTFDRTGQCVATAALLYWMDNTGAISGGTESGKTYIAYVLEAIRDIDNRFPLRGVADKAYKFGIPSTGPSVASDYLGMEGWGWAFAYSVARTYTGAGQLVAGDITAFANTMLTGGSWDLEAAGTTCQIRLAPITGTASTNVSTFTLSGSGTLFASELAPDDLVYLKSSVSASTSVGFYVRVSSITNNTTLTVRGPLTFRNETYTIVNSGGFTSTTIYDKLFKVPARTASHCGFLYNVIQHDTVPATLGANHRFSAAAMDGAQLTLTSSAWADEVNSKYRLSNSPAPPARSACLERYPYWIKLDSEIMKITGASGTCPTLTLTVERAQFGTTAATHNAQTVWFGYTNNVSWDGWNNQVATRLDAVISLSLALMGDDSRAATLFEKAVNYYIQYGVTPAFRSYNTLWGPAWNDYSRSRTDRFLAHILAWLRNGLSPSLDYSGDWLKRLFGTGYLYTFTPWDGKDHARFGNQGGTCMTMQNPACWFGPPFLWAFASGSNEAKYAYYHLVNNGAFTLANLSRIEGFEVFFPALLFVPYNETGLHYNALPTGTLANTTDKTSTRRYDMVAAKSAWTSTASQVMQYGMAALSDKLIGFQAAAFDIGKGDNWLLRSQKQGSYYGYTAQQFNRFMLGKTITTPGGVSLFGAEYRGPYILGADQVRSPDTLPNPVFDWAHLDANYWATRSNFKNSIDTAFHGFTDPSTFAYRYMIHFRNAADDDWVVILTDAKSTVAQKMEEILHYTQNNESTYAFRLEGKSTLAADPANGMTGNTAGGYYVHSRWPHGVSYMSDLGAEITAYGTATTPTSVAIGRDCTATAPCRAKIGSSTYSWTGSGTFSATVPVSSGLYAWTTSAGALEASTQGGTGLSCTGIITCVSWPGSIPAGAARVFAYSRTATGSAMAPCTDQYSSSAYGSTYDQCVGSAIETNSGQVEEGSRHLFLRAGGAATGVTEAKIVTAHHVTASVTPDTVAAISTINANWLGVEKQGVNPNVAVFTKDGVLRSGADFTSTHSGTGRYVVAGLQYGLYDVLVDGTPVVSNQLVVQGDHTLYWTSSAGAVSVQLVGANPLIITTTSPLPSGTVGVGYSQQLAAAGGVGPYTWARSAGVDCGGLSISSAGLVSGTPTTAETCTPTYRATDSDSPTPQTASRQFSITISAAPQGGGGTGTGVGGASVGGGRVN